MLAVRDWENFFPCAKRHDIFSIEAMVRGYHVYKSIWTGEEFETVCGKEPI
jgi:hypothetical protein